jgi:tetratricopeptide (TPR) repeat protein
MTATENQEKPNKDLMDAILKVIEGGNPEEIAAKVDMDPQQLLALSDSFAKKTFQDTVLGEAGRRKIGRNKPCPCGSGKKYKKCCLRKHEKAGELLRGTEAVDFQQPETEEGPPQYVVKGFDLLAAGSYDEAIGYANDLLSTYPEDDRIHDTLASAQLANGKYDQTIDICRSRWEVSKEEKSFFLEHGHHKRLPQDGADAPPHFYAPETWLEKYWIALKSKQYSTLLPDPLDPETERLIDELLTANDLERFPAQQEKGLEERRAALAPTLEELKQVGSDALPYLLRVMSQYSWAALFVPEIIAHYSTDVAIRSLLDLTMFNYHFVSEACLKHLETLGADILPYIRDAFTRDQEFDPLKVGFINMLSNLDAAGADELLVELLESEEVTVVDWASLALGKRNRTDLLPVLEEASARIGDKPRISWAINHLKKISEGNE